MYEHHSSPVVIDQQNRIKSEIALKFSLVGSLVHLSDLKDAYEPNTTTAKKVSELSKIYPHFRKIRPDGNCFYRALMWGSLESAIRTNSLDSFRALLKTVSRTCIEEGYDSFAIEEFHDLLDENIGLIQGHSLLALSIQQMELTFGTDASIDGYAVAFLRCACGAALKKWQEEYMAFLPEPYTSMESFCRNEVDPMNKDADEIHLVALSRLLGLKLSVAYIDGSDSESVKIHQFGEPSSSLHVCLLYRPGHYDLIYPAS